MVRNNALLLSYCKCPRGSAFCWSWSMQKSLSIRNNLIMYYFLLYKVRESELNFVVCSLVLTACNDCCQLFWLIPIYEYSPPSKQTMAHHEILILLKGAGKFALSLQLLLFTPPDRLVIIERWQSAVC